MMLARSQIEQYDRDGYLILPNLFTPDEVSTLLDEVERVSKVEADCVFREGDDDLIALRGGVAIFFAAPQGEVPDQESEGGGDDAKGDDEVKAH